MRPSSSGKTRSARSLSARRSARASVSSCATPSRTSSPGPMAATSSPSIRTAARATRCTSARMARGYPALRERDLRLGQPVAQRRRLAEVEALGVVDAHAPQQRRRLAVADVLGHRALAEPARDVDDRLDDELVGPVDGRVADELAVDLQVVERQVLEVVERAEARTEVVEGEAAAEVGQAGREVLGARDVGDRDRLGDLEDDLARADLAGLQLA